MRRLFTLIAMAAVGVGIVGCGETTEPKKAPTTPPTTTPGPADKGDDKPDDKPATP